MKHIIHSFLKIGIIGFGGGSALIPVIEAETVQLRGYTSRERYAEHTILSNITPGALPVKLGMLVGGDVAGTRGMVASAFAVALPGTVLTVLLLLIMEALGAGVVQQITFASVGISAFILYLLAHYIQKVLTAAKKEQFLPTAVVLMLASAAVTCGKELRMVLTLLFGERGIWSGAPLLDISTIQLLILGFFFIFFTGGRRRSSRTAFACVLSVFYALLFGKARLLGVGGNSLLQAAMLLLGVAVAVYDARGTVHNVGTVDCARLLRQVLAFASIIAVTAAFAFLLVGDVTEFLADGAFSAVTSFGGGEAYLTVADGMFVATGQVSSSVFYGQIVPVANALPGPILIKILAGIGYVLGFENGGALQGCSMALLGLAIGVGCTCIVCLLVGAVYRMFSGLSIFDAIRLWILPIICGLLLTTMLTMLGEMLRVSAQAGLPSLASGALVAALCLLAPLLAKKTRLRDMAVIVLLGILSAGLLNFVR